MENKELEFLRIISSTLEDSSLLGDDCAYLEDLGIVLTQDALVEDVHFKLNTTTPYLLAQKAITVNISDVAASGALPLYVTLSISGKLNASFIKEFYQGVEKSSQKYNIKVAGGDLTGGDKIVISVCAVGSLKGANLSSRKNAKSGYVAAVWGNHGSSAYGLELLTNSKQIDFNNTYIKAHLNPQINLQLCRKIALLAKKPYAMMDTSDGLYDAFYKISKASNVGFDIDYSKIPKEIDDKNLVLYGGEDYGIFVCLDKKDFTALKQFGLTKIANVINDKKIFIDSCEVQDYGGFNHFES